MTNYYLTVTSFMMVLSVATMFVLTFSIVSMAMGFGAVYPRFKHENIAQVSMGFGGLSYMIVSSLVTGVVILIEAWPVYMIFIAQKKGPGDLRGSVDFYCCILCSGYGHPAGCRCSNR